MAYPPLQSRWLKLLPDLLHIPKWRGSKETAVFAGELGAADIANVIRRSRRIHRVGQHEPSSLLQAKVFLILKGGHVGECLEMVLEIVIAKQAAVVTTAEFAGALSLRSSCEVKSKES